MHNQGWVDDAIAHRQGLRVTLVGDPSGQGPLRSTRDALGARVVVTADTDGDGAPDRLTREVRAGGGNATSSSDLALSFGLGVAETAELAVHWPSGGVTRLSGVAMGEVTVAE